MDHPMLNTNLMYRKSSKAMHLLDLKPIWGYKAVKWVLSDLSYTASPLEIEKWCFSSIQIRKLLDKQEKKKYTQSKLSR